MRGLGIEVHAGDELVSLAQMSGPSGQPEMRRKLEKVKRTSPTHFLNLFKKNKARRAYQRHE